MTTDSLTAPPSNETSGSGKLIGATIVCLIVWFVVYWYLEPFSKWAVSLMPIARGSHLEEAASFFIYDTPKVLMLLALVVFGMGVVRSFFSPERTRAFLAGKREGLGNVAAASLGIVTPFCSCSAVPLFVGFVSSGVPLGVTFSFLIASPMINEVALGLLFALAGWKVALTYLAFGLAVAIIAAIIPVAAGQPTGTLPWVAAATPLPFAILATLYAEVAARIGRAAEYIQTTLQPRLAKRTEPNDALGWEQFVHEEDPARQLLWLTDKLRYLIFFLPAILAYVLSFRLPVPPAWGRWDLFFKIVDALALLGPPIVLRWSERVLKGIVSEPKD